MPSFGEALNPQQQEKFKLVKKMINAEMNVSVDETFAKKSTAPLVRHLKGLYPEAYARVLRANQLTPIQAAQKIEENDFVFLKKALVELSKQVPLTESGNHIFETLAKNAGIKPSDMKEAVQLLSIAGGIKVKEIFDKEK